MRKKLFQIPALIIFLLYSIGLGQDGTNEKPVLNPETIIVISYQNSPNDKSQIEDEINSLNANIKGWEVRLNSLKIRFRRWLAVESLDDYKIAPLSLDINDEDYFGKYYVEESFDEVFKKAILNDTESKVLQLVIDNAQEKKRLAERGKWDIFATIRGRCNYYGLNEDDQSTNYYSASLGLNIKKMDKEVLNYSILKAESDILNIQTHLADRKIELATKIRQQKEELIKQLDQWKSATESCRTRKEIFELKLEKYLAGEESVDILLQAFRSLISTEHGLFRLENDYFDNIRDLDYLCGVYFEKLGITIE